MAALETYPFPDDYFADGKIAPLVEIEVHDALLGDRPCRRAMVCHSCCHRLDPDMWVDVRSWESINPSVPALDLPEWEHRA